MNIGLEHSTPLSVSEEGRGLGCWINCLWSMTGEGNGSPLQCCCLENPRDRGAWWAAVYGVAWSQTQLKRLSSSSSSSRSMTTNYADYWSLHKASKGQGLESFWVGKPRRWRCWENGTLIERAWRLLSLPHSCGLCISSIWLFLSYKPAVQ